MGLRRLVLLLLTIIAVCALNAAFSLIRRAG
jgi:hypothetical protein